MARRGSKKRHVGENNICTPIDKLHASELRDRLKNMSMIMGWGAKPPKAPPGNYVCAPDTLPSRQTTAACMTAATKNLVPQHTEEPPPRQENELTLLIARPPNLIGETPGAQ